MVKVKSVSFGFSENGWYQRRYPNASKNPVTFPTVRDASEMLAKMAHNMEHDIGYDKTDFVIEWEDGQTYEGRYDLHKFGQRQENPNGQCDLADHVRGWLRFLSGDRKPSHMTEQKYAECLKTYMMTEFKQAEVRDFLAEYSLS